MCSFIIYINFGMMLSDFLFLLLTPETPVSLAPLLDEGSWLVLTKSSLFSELLCWFVSKLSSEDSSSPDRLLSVATSVLALSLTEYYLYRIVFLLLLEHHWIISKKSKCSYTVLPLIFLIPSTRAVEKFCLISLTLF